MRLNLGSGGQYAPGWTTLDKSAPDADWQVDMTDGLPFLDEQCEMVVAHHCLDLIDACALNGVLAEVHRVLEPEGWLRVSLFDPARAFEAAYDQDMLWFADRGAPGGLVRKLDWMLHQDGARQWITTPWLLAQVLEGAGFAVQRQSCMVTNGPPDLVAFDSRADESFFVDGRKVTA